MSYGRGARTWNTLFVQWHFKSTSSRQGCMGLIKNLSCENGWRWGLGLGCVASACFYLIPVHGTTYDILLLGLTIIIMPHSTCILDSVGTHGDSVRKNNPGMNNWREFWKGCYTKGGLRHLVFNEHWGRGIIKSCRKGGVSGVSKNGLAKNQKSRFPYHSPICYRPHSLLPLQVFMAVMEYLINSGSKEEISFSHNKKFRDSQSRASVAIQQWH